jgi:hypothetical protein
MLCLRQETSLDVDTMPYLSLLQFPQPSEFRWREDWHHHHRQLLVLLHRFLQSLGSSRLRLPRCQNPPRHLVSPPENWKVCSVEGFGSAVVAANKIKNAWIK